MKIATIQCLTLFDNDTYNYSLHHEMIKKAIQYDAKVIVFPELSLSSYTHDITLEMCITKNDSKLIPFIQFANNHQCLISIGAPIKEQDHMYIGQIVFQPYTDPVIYKKHFLHGEEDLVFTKSELPITRIEFGGLSFSPLICAEIRHDALIEEMAKIGIHVLLVSMFSDVEGINYTHKRLESISKKYGFHVILSNYSGQLWDLESGGRSAYWDNSGTCVSSLDSNEQNMLLVTIQ